MESETITLQELFRFNVEQVTPDRMVIGRLQPTGLRPTFMQKFERRGIALPLDLFRETRMPESMEGVRP
jgi:pilus assembly protein CpaF